CRGKTATPFARGGKPATPFARGGKDGDPLRKGGKRAQRNRDENAACARPTFHQSSPGRPARANGCTGQRGRSLVRLPSRRVSGAVHSFAYPSRTVVPGSGDRRSGGR